ncbi:MAG: hypothetical protein VXX04_02930, partial [Actinomycetota bacterium]|nr:hypothetical protein [Actinomycetota bacterium]
MEHVLVTFGVVGVAAEYDAVRRQSISGIFSSYTGVASGDILTTVAEDGPSRVGVLVDITVPTGTAASSIASTINNGIFRSVEVLQAALQNTGGTVVSDLGTVRIEERYVAVFPPPGPGPPLSETIIIVIAVGGVVGLIALIFVARNCDAAKLRETVRLVLGIARTATGSGPGAESADPADARTINVVVSTDAPKSKPDASKSKPNASKSKPDASKSKPNASKSKPNASKSKPDAPETI